MHDQYENRPLTYGSDEYRAALALRDAVLSRPLGLKLGEQLGDESDEHHLGFFLNRQLVGVLILSARDPGEIKMRQVAVAEGFRGIGIGTRLVRYAEEYAERLGYEKIRLHSRKTAVGFYEKLGYRKVGTEFLEVGIPHYEMVKELKQPLLTGLARQQRVKV